jgi:hypothetical protein
MFNRKSKSQKHRCSKTKANKRAEASPLWRWWGGLSDDTKTTVRGVILWAVLIAAASGATVWGLGEMEAYLLAEGGDCRVETIHSGLVNRPDWLPYSTARAIAGSFVVSGRGFDDPSLTREIYLRAAANPWVRRVHSVTKELGENPRIGVVNVHCEFRRPVARIMRRTDVAVIAQNIVYVDGDGVVLPTQQTPRYETFVKGEHGARRRITYVDKEESPPLSTVRRIHYPFIQGVRVEPPRVGQVWRGEDMAAGLRLVMLISDKPYANQITAVDVRNYGGRISSHEPHLRMRAQIGGNRPTDIKFGRFPIVGGGDYVIDPQRKLEYLDEYAYENNGQLAGLKDYLDLRYDQLHVSIN